jgi:hypothetical protein
MDAAIGHDQLREIAPGDLLGLHSDDDFAIPEMKKPRRRAATNQQRARDDPVFPPCFTFAVGHGRSSLNTAVGRLVSSFRWTVLPQNSFTPGPPTRMLS